MVRPLMESRWIGLVRTHAGSAIWSALEQGIGPLLQLALTPVLLHAIGPANYAVWAIGISLVGLSQLVSGGAGFATLKHVSADLGAQQPEAARYAIRAALALAASGGMVAALSAWLLAPVVVSIGFGQMGAGESLSAVLSLCGLGMLINEVDLVFACAMRGAQRFDLAARGEWVGRLLMVAVVLWLALHDVTVVPLFRAWIALLALKVGIKALVVTRLFDGLLPLPSFKREPLRRMFAFGRWQWLQAAGTTLFTSMDQLVVGSVLGAAALARYSVCLQLAQYVHFMPSVLLQVIFPTISARGRTVGPIRGNRILDIASLLALGIALVLGCVLTLLAVPVLGHWVDGGFAAQNATLLRVLVAAHVLLAVNIGGYYVLLATGRIARLSATVLGAGALQLVAMLVAAQFGLLAVAASRFVYSAITASLWNTARYRT